MFDARLFSKCGTGQRRVGHGGYSARKLGGFSINCEAAQNNSKKAASIFNWNFNILALLQIIFVYAAPHQRRLAAGHRLSTTNLWSARSGQSGNLARPRRAPPVAFSGSLSQQAIRSVTLRDNAAQDTANTHQPCETHDDRFAGGCIREKWRLSASAHVV